MPAIFRNLAIICALCASSCAVLFFQDATSSAGGSWIGTDRFVENQSEFERKSHWFALNQNAITRNYETTLILHETKDGAVVSSRDLVHYKGWTLNDSIFAAGSSLIALRGNSDSLGDFRRELIAVPFPGPGEAKTILQTPETILSAVPSPNGKQIAVFLTDATDDNRTGNLFVEFHDFTSGPAPALSRKSRASVKWSGVPGNPELSWARDSAGVYLHVEDSVLFVSSSGTSRRADQFPICFIQTNSGRTVSDAGLFFARQQDKTIELQKQDAMRFEDVPMTGSVSELGRGCP